MTFPFAIKLIPPLYSKGGIQYLTDDELKEQRTGAHKRR